MSSVKGSFLTIFLWLFEPHFLINFFFKKMYASKRSFIVPTTTSPCFLIGNILQLDNGSKLWIRTMLRNGWDASMQCCQKENVKLSCFIKSQCEYELWNVSWVIHFSFKLPMGTREFTIMDFGDDGDPWRSANERGQGHLLCLGTVS